MAKKANAILPFLALFLFSYTLVRACLLSITWDEAYSYLQFVRNGIIIPEKFEQMSANNHLLNTFLDILFVKCFGPSEFVLRIPSLLSHILFLYFSYRLVREFANPVLVIASYVIINFNPYLLDFFSLARGYGLSMGLMMASIFFLYQYIQQQRARDAAMVIVFASLATAANFVLLNYLVVVSGVLLLIMFLHKNTKDFLRAALLPLILTAFSLILMVPLLLKLKEAGALFYGGSHGFWTDTLSTIIDRQFYEIGYNYWFQRAAKGLVILTLLAAPVIIVFRFLKKEADKSVLVLTSLFLILTLCALSTIVQHYIFGTLYLQDRTALFLSVLFVVLFVFVLNELVRSREKAVFIGPGLAIAMIVHFVLCFNKHYVLEWKWDADIKEMLTDLGKIKVVPKGKQNVSIGIPLEMDQGINYYRAKDQLNWLNTVERSDLRDRRYNYLFFGPDEAQKLNMDSVEILKRYPRTGNVLAKPKYPLAPDGENQFQYAENMGSYILPDSVEYAPTIIYSVPDSIVPDLNAELVYDVVFIAEDPKNSNVFMVVSIEDKNGLILWQRASIRDYIGAPGETATASFSALVPHETVAGNIVKAYIWNPYRQKLQIKSQRLSWLKDK